MFIAANWKMNLDLASGEALISKLNDHIVNWSEISVIICPPAPYIQSIHKAAHADFHLGGQTCHEKSAGAHTGHVSADMLVDCGASYVIIGHSERRQNDGETGDMLKAQANAAIQAGLKVIYCVGETLEDRQAGREENVVSAQLADIMDLLKVGAVPVIAYEPVWAIGTGQVASVSDIKAMHDFIKSEISNVMTPRDLSKILYGGSVKPDNAEAILSIESVDGALVGGASLDAKGFAAICDCAQRVSS